MSFNISDIVKQHLQRSDTEREVKALSKVEYHKNGKPKKEKRVKINCTNDGSYNELIAALKEQGADFNIKKTSKTVRVSVGNKDYFFSESLAFTEVFTLQNQLKKLILKNKKAVQDAPYPSNPWEIDYYNFNDTLRAMSLDAGAVYEYKGRIIEADITAAYYRAALNLGFIDEKFYRRCMKIKKEYRLRLMGAIATLKIEEDYEAGELVSITKHKDDLLREAWFKICAYVDEALKTFRACLKDNFLFYWVDGIYFIDPQTTADNVREAGYSSDIDFILSEVNRQFHFDWKVLILKRFQLINDGSSLRIEVEKPNGEVKRFFPSKNVIKSYSLVNKSEFE